MSAETGSVPGLTQAACDAAIVSGRLIVLSAKRRWSRVLVWLAAPIHLMWWTAKAHLRTDDSDSAFLEPAHKAVRHRTGSFLERPQMVETAALPPAVRRALGKGPRSLSRS
jgi:hypothetical protein